MKMDEKVKEKRKKEIKYSLLYVVSFPSSYVKFLLPVNRLGYENVKSRAAIGLCFV